MRLLFLLIALPSVLPITINEISVQGDGEDPDNPLAEGDRLTVKCSADSEWSLCSWVMELDGEYDSNNQLKKLVCGTYATNGGSVRCNNHGGSDDLDDIADNIQLSGDEKSCTLQISDAEAIHGNKWRCNMWDDPSSAGAQIDKDIHISNQSTIFITEPDHFQDPNEMIEYTLDQSNERIEATCTAYGGKPDPEFHWYVNDDDDRSEIPDSDLTRYTDSRSDDLGDYIQESIRWSPTRDELCQFEDLENDCYEYQFSFDLICKVVQKAGSNIYYQSENEQQKTDVIVNIKSGAARLTTMVSSLLFLSFVTINQLI